MRKILLALIFTLTNCATIQRPDASVCVVNAPAKHLKCYNLKADYNENGQLKAGAVPHYFSANNIEELNKGVFMPGPDFAKVKVWIDQLRRAYDKQKGNK